MATRSDHGGRGGGKVPDFSRIRPATTQDALAELRARLDRGDLLGAYDIGKSALEDGLADERIRYRMVLALARAGATETAAREYEELGVRWQTDTDSRSLWGRILKDRAFVGPAGERKGSLAAAAAVYRGVHDDTGEYFPGINAATLLVLAGDREAGQAIARALLEDRVLRDGAGYWAAATRAEIHLILGNAAEAATELAAARRLAGRRYSDLSSTRRQFGQLARALPPGGFDVASLLAVLRPPRVAHLATSDAAMPTRGLRAELVETFRRHEVGFATCALWSDASVEAAEAAIEAGLELNLVLPYGPRDYLDHVRERLPTASAERRRACLAAAASVTAVTADGDLDDPKLIEYAAVVAKGLARMRASALTTDCLDLPRAPRRSEEPSVDETRPSPASQALRREIRALLFADAKGFSKLPESQLPAFWSGFMAEVAVALDAEGDRILYRNTWGDAVFCVTDGIETAAHLALAVQDRAAALRARHPEMPVLRIGLHHGPVFRGWDQVRRTVSYFGTQVSRAARVEPIVPPGQVYVTEPFAAVLAASGAEGIESEYVGIIPLHKDYGRYPMYRLMRRGEEG